MSAYVQLPFRCAVHIGTITMRRNACSCAVMQERVLACRSMFVSDRSFFMRDPARSLYSTAAYYLSVMAVNAAVTIINAAILLLLMYGMIGEHAIPCPTLRCIWMSLVLTCASFIGDGRNESWYVRLHRCPLNHGPCQLTFVSHHTACQLLIRCL